MIRKRDASWIRIEQFSSGQMKANDEMVHRIVDPCSRVSMLKELSFSAVSGLGPLVL